MFPFPCERCDREGVIISYVTGSFMPRFLDKIYPSHLITINRLHAAFEHPLVDQTLKEATDFIQEVRDFSWELRPSVLDDLGFIPAIRSFLNRCFGE